ncbi:hypothetical protein [Streptomyces kronopolitis]|uniref:hypothetical protein n=1 Tax=Streptomyces kronopolitis TaxID=1612435 RepID=UPI003D996ABE
MSMQSEEQDNPAVDVGDLALRAAVAYRVKTRVAEICDPLIEANAEHIKTTKGLRSTEAEMPLDSGGTMPVGAFTRSLSKPKFVVEDDKKVLDYADELGETEYVVRPAFLKNLLSRLCYDPKTRAVIDSTTGELVPGIGYDPGGVTTSVSPKWNKAGTEALDTRLGFIDLALENLPELTAGDFLTVLEAGQ